MGKCSWIQESKMSYLKKQDRRTSEGIIPLRLLAYAGITFAFLIIEKKCC